MSTTQYAWTTWTCLYNIRLLKIALVPPSPSHLRIKKKTCKKHQQWKNLKRIPLQPLCSWGVCIIIQPITLANNIWVHFLCIWNTNATVASLRIHTHVYYVADSTVNSCNAPSRHAFYPFLALENSTTIKCGWEECRSKARIAKKKK